MHRAADVSVPALAAALGDTDSGVRFAAASALEEMGPRAEPAVVLLAAALRDKDPDVRHFAAEALGRIGPGAKAAVPALIEALRTWPADAPRPSVAAALAHIGPDAKAAIPALIVAFCRSSTRTRVTGCRRALGRIGPAAAEAVPHLLREGSEERPTCEFFGSQESRRTAAVRALGGIGPPRPSPCPFLIEQLKRPDPLVWKYEAATALGKISPAGKPAVPVLVAIVRDRTEDSITRRTAAEAVVQLDPAFAAKEKLATAWLDMVGRGARPLALKDRAPQTEAEAAKIRILIAKLADVGRPGVGLSPTVSGRAFAPIPGHRRMHAIVLGESAPQTSDAFRELVALGPAAMPHLLAALNDKTPTRLKVRRLFGSGILFVGGSADSGNPFNQKERRALDGDDDRDEGSGFIESYRVTVGDVCFNALGQIVGRDYSAVQYVPSAITAVNSPAHMPGLRDRLRTAWSGPDPRRVLLDSLLIDYATEGVFNGRSLDGWDQGSDYQTEAAVRLLYYFPDEMAPLIAARLKGLLDVGDPGSGDGRMNRDVRNRVRTVEFVKAVAWCRHSAIQQALAEICRKTDDEVVREALSGMDK